jgi:hypothetical protein
MELYTMQFPNVDVVANKPDVAIYSGTNVSPPSRGVAYVEAQASHNPKNVPEQKIFVRYFFFDEKDFMVKTSLYKK